MDGGPYGEPMTQSPIDLSRQGTHGCSAFFCALRNLSDCTRLEMLQTDFRREMHRSGSFAGVRGRPQSCDGVCDGVFVDDFGKNVRGRSHRFVRA